MQEPELHYCSRIFWGVFKLERCSLVALASVCLLLSACGKNGGARLTGTVIFDGKPLEKGSILFQSLEATNRRAESGSIVNGKFTIVPKLHLPAGRYSVVISSPAPVPQGVYPPGDKPAASETIPARYNDKTTLIIEVKEGRNDFTFTLVP